MNWSYVPQAHAAECNTDEHEEKEHRLTAVNEQSYMFQYFDLAVTKMFTERFPWIEATNKAGICTRKTAMPVELAYLLKP